MTHLCNFSFQEYAPYSHAAPAVIVPQPVEEAPKKQGVQMRMNPPSRQQRDGKSQSKLSQRISNIRDSLFPPPPSIEELEEEEISGEIDSYRKFQQNLARSRNAYTVSLTLNLIDITWVVFEVLLNHLSCTPRVYQCLFFKQPESIYLLGRVKNIFYNPTKEVSLPSLSVSQQHTPKCYWRVLMKISDFFRNRG